MIHSGASVLPSVLGRIGGIGDKGVQLFYIISAYLTFLSLNNKFAHKINGKSLFFWYIKKIIRLIPIYYLALIVNCIFYGGNNYWLGSEQSIKWGNVLCHLLFIHGFFPHYIDSIIGVEWYLGILVIFYAIAPLLYKYIDTLKKAVTAWIVSLFISPLIQSFLRNFIPETNDAYIYSACIENFSIVAQLPVILIGIILFFVIKEKKTKEQITFEDKVFSYAILVLAVILIVEMAYGKISIPLFSSFTIYGLFFCLIVYGQNVYPSKLICNSFFCLLGRLSYPIYLFHFFFLWVYNKYIAIEGSNVCITWGIKYVSVLTVSVFISIFLTKFVDKPLCDWLIKKVETLILSERK